MTHATNIARSGVALLVAMAAMWSTAALAEPLFSFFAPQAQTVTLQATSEEAAVESEEVMPATLRRQVVDYATREAAGTVVIDTPHTLLYYVLGNGKAIRYGIGVGREGFTWSGVKSVVRKAEWPDWYPPLKMIGRQPYLPRMTAGGPGNPLGARAMYIGGTEYRIHGTNNPATIGHRVSSGCIRLTNEDVTDLYARVQVGAKVIVLPQISPANIAQRANVLAYAPPPKPSQAANTWTTIRPAGQY